MCRKEGCGIDRDRNPTTEPPVLIAGGSQLPFGGYKGFALAVVGEVLGGILTGSELVEDKQDHNPFIAMAIDVKAFVPIDQFRKRIDELIGRIHSAPRIRDAQVLLPGERQFR